ncbi:MAG: ATPase, T2SS/T4P/T4SS family, partial [Candidatus Omnitrophica bacterium]|nr:ATPase, T2SS/T4P/T4SS family [Candidatus Omnitrophota bacterium]
MNDTELGTILVSAKLISEENLARALDEMKKLKRPLEKVVVEMGFIPRQKLFEVIAKNSGFNFAKLDVVKVPEEMVQRMPESLAIQTQSVPFRMESGVLHVAMVEPSDLFSIDQIQMQTGLHVEPYLAGPEDVEEARLKVYARKQQTESLMTDFAQTAKPHTGKSVGEGASIIKLVDLIIAQAVHDRASDIHIEPEQEIVRIRFRIDGILHEVPSPPKDWEAAIISRIKVLAGMDIAESRVPQDGHFQSKIDDKIIDF